MSHPVEDFRQLPTAELRSKLRELRHELTKVDIDEELGNFAAGLLTHLMTLTHGTYEWVDRQLEAVEQLPQGHPGKEALKADLNQFVFLAPSAQEKMKDRLHRALVNRAPEPEKKKAKKGVEVGGIMREFPEGLGPDD